MEVGSKHGYTGVEHKKKRSIDKGDDDDEEEKEMEGGDNIFGRVKQINVHVWKDGCGGSIVFCRCRRR